MNRRSRLILIAFTLSLMLACLADTSSACPTCKDAMAGDPANAKMVQGYFWSILFMMSMPFLVFTGVASYFYYEVRRARARQAAVATATASNAPPNASASPEISLQS
jgi:heme/copper-type cytochrome/quinol oxidase subunit 2